MNKLYEEIFKIKYKYDLLKQTFSKHVYFTEGLETAKQDLIKRLTRNLMASKSDKNKDPFYKYNL